MRHRSIESLASELLGGMGKSRSALVFAPNTTGKTRLAQYVKDSDPEGVVLYNAFVEDVFTWDNERVVLNMSRESELLGTIETQGLDGIITENFQRFTDGRLEPTLDLSTGDITFGIHRGDDASADSVKISRAEESVFIWSVYYSILKDAIDTLSDSPDLRSTTDYDGLTFAVIDDPVSSMDDMRIITVAIALAELIKSAKHLDFKFLITTHHALFFNVLYNSLRRSQPVNLRAFALQRIYDGEWILKQQPNDSPFSYHLRIIDEIQSAIDENAIRRTHFNQFRALLEKTANFLGYKGGWSALLTGPNAGVLTRVLNLYSHDRFSDIEPSVLSEEYREAFKMGFEEFLRVFRWGRL